MSTSWGNFHFWVNNPFNELDINNPFNELDIKFLLVSIFF